MTPVSLDLGVREVSRFAARMLTASVRRLARRLPRRRRGAPAPAAEPLVVSAGHVR